MSDDDPIRRGDAAAAMARYHWERYSSRADGGKLSTPAVFTSHTWQDVQDIISALPAVQPQGVKVKPLVWAKHPKSDIWRCDTMFGGYKVFGVGSTPSWDFDSATNVLASFSHTAPDVASAFAAAQADYEARILAAIEPAPMTLAAALALPEITALVEAGNRWRAARTKFADDGSRRVLVGDEWQHLGQAESDMDTALRRIAEGGE